MDGHIEVMNIERLFVACFSSNTIRLHESIEQYLTPLRQARETYVCANLLRKRNISMNYYLDTFLTKIILKKIISL